MDRNLVPLRRSACDGNLACGFTLVEVLVALFVMAIMAGMAWRGIDGVARAREAGDGQLQRSLRLTNVMAQWELDLHQIRDTHQVPAIEFDGATLRLTRRAEGGIQLIAWSVRQNGWTRWASPAVKRVDDLQEAWMHSRMLNGSEPEQLVALDSVTGWQLRFFRNGDNQWSNAQSSGDTTTTPAVPASSPSGTPPPKNGPAPSGVPIGVRIILATAAGPMTRDVQLAVQQDAN